MTLLVFVVCTIHTVVTITHRETQWTCILLQSKQWYHCKLLEVISMIIYFKTIFFCIIMHKDNWTCLHFCHSFIYVIRYMNIYLLNGHLVHCMLCISSNMKHFLCNNNLRFMCVSHYCCGSFYEWLCCSCMYVQKINLALSTNTCIYIFATREKRVVGYTFVLRQIRLFFYCYILIRICWIMSGNLIILVWN